MTVDFLSEAMESQIRQNKELKENNYYSRIQHPVKISFRIKNKIKTFSGEENLGEIYSQMNITRDAKISASS